MTYQRSIRQTAVLAAVTLTAGLTFARQDTPATQPATRPTGVLPTTTPGAITQTRNGILLNFQDATIDTVLNELSSAAGFVVVKEIKPEGRVTLVSKQPLSPSDAVSLLNTVLRNAGYAAIQQERILKIVARDQAKRLNIPVRTGGDPSKIANTDELITQVIPLRYADATQLKADLQPLINPEADFASNASSNALILTDTSANARRLAEIVAALDTSVADSVDVKVFQLKYAKASDAATLINSVFGTLDAGRTQGSESGGNRNGGNRGTQGGGQDRGEQVRQFFQQQQQGGGTGGNRGGQQAGQRGKTLSAGADERTNSVVVSGSADALAIVANVVKELDANPAAEDKTFVVRLRNAQAVNVESTLNNLFNGTAPSNRSVTNNADLLRQYRSSNGNSFSSSSTSGGGTSTFGGGARNTGGNANSSFSGQNRVSSNTQQAANELAGQVTIIADPDSNSLLVNTSPANIDRVKGIIDELDKPVAQVLIKVLVAEVTHENGYDLGTEFSILNLRAGTNAAGEVVPNGEGQSGGSNFGIPTGATGTGLVVQLLESNFTAGIRALETAGKLDVLSRPYILASDNQLASITVGQQVPFVTRTQVTDGGSTNNSYERQDVGILLDVISHINPDGLVILDVAPEISSLTSSTVQVSEGVFVPIINRRSAQTHVAVRTGQTIVIGGLMEDRVTETINKVPFLGDIPFVGELFKRRQKNKTKTELLIFLTPHIAAQPSELEGMGRDEVKGTKLLPGAVEPGVYDEHRRNMERGAVSNEAGPGVDSTTKSAADPMKE